MAIGTFITVVQGAQLAMAAYETAMAAMEKFKIVGGIVTKAQAEGRTELTTEEWQDIQAVDDKARVRLEQAIAKAPS